MKISYDKLLKLLESKNLNKSDLISLAGVNSNVVAEIGKGNSISLNAITNICSVFLCQPSDIMEFIYSENEVKDHERKKVIRILTQPNVIKIPSEDGKINKYYMVHPDPSTGALANSKVEYMTQLPSKCSPEIDELYERDQFGTIVPADAVKLAKELEEKGFTDEYKKADIRREAKGNSFWDYYSPYPDI